MLEYKIAFNSRSGELDSHIMHIGNGDMTGLALKIARLLQTDWNVIEDGDSITVRAVRES